MTHISYTQLVQGNPDNAADINTPLDTIVAKVNALDDVLGGKSTANSLLGSDLSASAAIADTQLASPNNATQKAIFNAGAYFGGSGAATYYPSIAGTAIANSSATTGSPPLIFTFVTADHAVAGKTTNFRTDMQIAVGSTSPSTTVITAGLYPLTIASGNYTLGTVVTGSTIGSSGLTTNTVSKFSSSVYAASALTTATPYVIGVVVSTLTVPAGISVNVTINRANT